MQSTQLVPAALTESPHPSTGRRYQFFSTQEIVNRLEDRGFTVAHSSQSLVRKETYLGYQRHQVFLDFPKEDGLAIPTQRIQLRLVNSHCGTAALRLYLAVFVQVCSNGLIAPRDHHDLFKLRHVRNRFDSEFVHDKALLEAAKTLNQIGHMENRELTLDEQMKFAHYAIGLRWPDNTQPPFDPKLMLTARFASQNQPDLWSVLNRVQDNVLNGFTYFNHELRKERRVRKLTSIPRDLNINQRLWTFAAAL